MDVPSFGGPKRPPINKIGQIDQEMSIPVKCLFFKNLRATRCAAPDKPTRICMKFLETRSSVHNLAAGPTGRLLGVLRLRWQNAPLQVVERSWVELGQAPASDLWLRVAGSQSTSFSFNDCIACPR